MIAVLRDPSDKALSVRMRTVQAGRTTQTGPKPAGTRLGGGLASLCRFGKVAPRTESFECACWLLTTIVSFSSSFSVR